jgi:hypothetical protein
MRHFALPLVSTLVVALGSAGCASTKLDAQWADGQLAGTPLRGARVLVACEAYEPVVKQLCRDQVASELTARGATPVAAPQVAESTPGRPVSDDQLLQAARTAGAKAVLVVSMSIGSHSGEGSGFSIGLGGFGGGSHVGGGVGVSLPIGGAQGLNGYSANSRLTDAWSSRLLWTAKASAPPSGDVPGQVRELAHTLLDAAGKAGAF